MIEAVDVLQTRDRKIAGRCDPKTTARYDRRPEAAKRKAASSLHFPWRQRRFWVVDSDRGR